LKAFGHSKLLVWAKVHREVTLTICWIQTLQQKVKHHNRSLNFRLYTLIVVKYI